MAAEIYFIAQDNANTARAANKLASDAHRMLTRIHTVRNEIAADRTGEHVDSLTRSWHGLVDARNWIIMEWQRLTGRQWETYGENHTRV